MLHHPFVFDAPPSSATPEKLSTAHARAMLRRLPRFALCWLGTTALWNFALVLEGLADVPQALLTFAVGAGVLLAAYRACHSKAFAARITPVLVTACVFLGATSTALFASVHGNGDVLAFLLLTLYLAAALFFSWGWRAELVLLASTVAVWLAAAPHMVFTFPRIELVTAICIGSVLSLGIAAASARTFRLAYLHWANEQRGKRELEASRDDAERARDEADRLRHEADRARHEAERARDEAEHSRHEAELARDKAEGAYKDAEAATRSKDVFLAMVSHELRSPISAVLSWTEVLRRDQSTSARIKHALDVIERTTRAQARLIEDLLDVARIVSGKLKVEIAPVDMCAVVHIAADVLRPAADEKGIALDIQLPGEPIEVRGDAARLHQVVENLISNAIKFTPEHGQVCVVVERQGADIEFRVHDSGMGIDPARLTRIFERFEQADPATARRHGGLGLGLSIARHIVELHGGTIEAESSGPDQGSTFKVRLRAQANEKHAGEHRSLRV